ncbi:hypothetical protein PF002_g30628 [Phytophthora fragariae]|nr:hypothetical protein PF002_g30628 [Phytophthora fragariae]
MAHPGRVDVRNITLPDGLRVLVKEAGTLYPLLSLAPVMDEQDDQLNTEGHRHNTDLLEEAQHLARKLRTPRQAAKLRTDDSAKSPLIVVLRQDTRWPSTFSMLKRYFQMIEFISADDEDLAAFLPSRVSHCKLEALFASLRDVESVTKRIQANDPTLLDALTSAEEAVFVSFLGVRATMPDPASMCAEGFAE